MTPRRVFVCATVFALFLAAVQVHATPLALEDLNSRIQIDPAGAGMTQWTVDGVNRLNQHTFYYRVGSSGPERPIGTLNIASLAVNDILGDGTNQHLTVQYNNAGPGSATFGIRGDVLLMGGMAGSGASSLTEIVAIDNYTAAPLNFHLFRYSDFDLDPAASPDVAMLQSDSSIRQFNLASGVAVTSGVSSAGHWEMSGVPNLLNSLNDSLPTTLIDNPSFSGNASFAFQWDITIAPRGSYIISTTTSIEQIPEPGILSIAAFGFAVMLRKRWR